MAGPISVEGLDKVLRSFDAVDKSVRDAAMKGMEAGSMNIIADAQDNLRTNGSVVTGLLRQSGKVQKVDKENIDVGFFDTQNKQGGYAEYVEYGRKAGRMPPVDMLAQWAYKKFSLHDMRAALSMGWAMAVKIARKGTTPHPFFMPAVDKNKSRIISVIKDAIKRVTK